MRALCRILLVGFRKFKLYLYFGITRLLRSLSHLGQRVQTEIRNDPQYGRLHLNSPHHRPPAAYTCVTFTVLRDRWQAVSTKWTLPDSKKRHRL